MKDLLTVVAVPRAVVIQEAPLSPVIARALAWAEREKDHPIFAEERAKRREAMARVLGGDR